MSRKRVVGIGPSLVDIGAKLSDQDYERCCTILDAEPGDWRRIEDSERAEQILRTISGAALHSVSFMENLNNSTETTIVPGSSTLGMLGAMGTELRTDAAYVSTLAVRDKSLEPLSAFFNGAVTAAGIEHGYQTIEGRNPMGFVLSSTSTAEKILGMYPGVANDLHDYDLASLHPDLVILDTYELLEGEMAAYLNEVICSGEYRIALSLGNRTILNGSVRDTIREYIATRKIDILCGNVDEYQELFPELDAELTTKEGFRTHPIKDYIPFALMTMGEEGSVAAWNGRIVEGLPSPIDNSRIINTSGAGDVTAGVFCSGVLRREDSKETLRKAAFYASQVLQIQGSMILVEDEVLNKNYPA